MTTPQHRLILVYNADGGLANALKDMVHKIIAPRSYPCSLCALTYGWFSMNRRWRRFLEDRREIKQFLYRNEFAAAFPGLEQRLPVIMLSHGNAAPQVMVSAAELDSLENLEGLIALLASRLEALPHR